MTFGENVLKNQPIMPINEEHLSIAVLSRPVNRKPMNFRIANVIWQKYIHAIILPMSRFLVFNRNLFKVVKK